jgi:hypothetical protein
MLAKMFRFSLIKTWVASRPHPLAHPLINIPTNTLLKSRLALVSIAMTMQVSRKYYYYP